MSLFIQEVSPFVFLVSFRIPSFLCRPWPVVYFHSIITIEPNDNLSAFANSTKTSTHLTDDDDDDDRDADFPPPKHPSTQAQGREGHDGPPSRTSLSD